jgi:two-component system, chemotaxis family, protein-glutamate methylesterase/glutaminase
VVQDPNDAIAASMPQSASQIAGAEHVVTVAELPPLLTRLIQQPLGSSGGAPMPDAFERMPEIVDADMQEQMHNKRNGRVSLFSCPECGGTLWQVDETKLVGFRCHVGHIYQAETLLSEQDNALEAALWTAVRIFKERYLLSTQLAQREQRRGNLESVARYADQAQLAERYGEMIRRLILTSALPVGELQGPAAAKEEPPPAP